MMKSKLQVPQTAETRNPRGSMVSLVLFRRSHPAYALADDVHRSPYMKLAVAPVKITQSIENLTCERYERKQWLQNYCYLRM